MKLEDQVSCLSLSRRLKELGVKQESLFVWTERDGVFSVGFSKFIGGQMMTNIMASAFTAVELCEMLPRRMGPKLSALQFRYGLDGWMTYYTGNEIQTAKTEADSRAKMLCYLIEQKPVKP